MGSNTEHTIIEHNPIDTDYDDDKDIDLSLQTRHKSVRNDSVKIYADNYQ